ncbi:MAG: hypothetical protein ABIH89_08555 [Elusimicrobiota bacterium]
MNLYKIKKLDKQIYTVEVSSWVLRMQLNNMKEFTQIGDENVYSFRISMQEDNIPNGGEKKFQEILKEKGINLELYPLY